MSTFSHGFKHGFNIGMFNNMFNGGWCNPFGNPFSGGWCNPFTPSFTPFSPFGIFGGGCCGPFNSFWGSCNFGMHWNSASMFMIPSYGFGGFTPYQSMSMPMPSAWNTSVPNFSTAPSWQDINYSSRSFTNPFISDTFVSTTKANTNENIKKNREQSEKLDKLEKPEDKKDVADTGIKTNYSAQELKAKWNKTYPSSNHLSNEFYEKLISISKEIECDPNDLMAVINLETAGTFRASAKNPNSNATGLIQFMPSTAKGLGTTVEKLAKMSEVEQLDYVKIYLLDRKKESKIKGSVDATTLYCFVFYPKAANQKNSYEIANNRSNNTKIYNWNKGLDYNKDKSLTRGDLAQRVKEFMV